MNIDTFNYGPFRVTRQKDNSETVLDTRTGHATALRKPLAQIRKEASENATGGGSAYDNVVKALESQINPI